MGQYYKAIFLTNKNKPKNFVDSHDFGCGLKLMEHSWMLNPFVRFVEKQLMIEPQKIVWGGDYADNEAAETITKEETKMLIVCEYTADEIKDGVNLYSLCNVVSKLTHNERVTDKYNHKFNCISLAPLTAKYLVNYDRKEFIDKTKVPKDNNGWRIHPLPLLTCEGNGRGGGDFRGESDLIGLWARNSIGVISSKTKIPKDFKEIIFNLIE